jgi:hypothetical protein
LASWCWFPAVCISGIANVVSDSPKRRYYRFKPPRSHNRIKRDATGSCRPGDEAVDQINTTIRDQIQLEGEYLMSATLVHGRPVLRVCIINHATRAEHIEGLLDSVLRIGRSPV